MKKQLVSCAIALFFYSAIVGPAYYLLANKIEGEAICIIEKRARGYLDFLSAVRSFTLNELATNEDNNGDGNDFQSWRIPSYNSREIYEYFKTFATESNDYKQIIYREVDRSPLFPNNQARGVELDFLKRLEAGETEIAEFQGGSYYLVRPIVANKPRCITCHGRISDRPQQVRNIYGSTPAWKIGHISAQVLQVSTKEVDKQKNSLLRAIALSFFLLLSCAIGVAFTALTRH